MEKTYFVYCHTNKTNGKKYVGITSRKNPKLRWNYGFGYEDNTVFFNAIKKYGWDTGFVHEILAEGLSLDQAESEERRLIKEWGTLKPNGYNIEHGGVHVAKHSAETIKKISLSHLGEKNPMFGKKISEETRAKLKLRKSNGDKVILQFDKEDNFIRSWKSASEAARSVGGDFRNISAAALGKRKVAYGYHWRYAREEVMASGSKVEITVD